MSISYSKLKKIAYFCLLLPSLVFVLGFLKWYIALPVTALLVAAYVFTLRDTKKEYELYREKEISLTKKQLGALIGVVMVWCFLSGLGNWYYQSGDWSARNAIFRDLIRFEWPVIYSAKNAALVYYIGYWLPPALIGKLFYGITADLDVAWVIGNFALWVWSVICVIVVILMVLVFINANTYKRFKTALIVFIAFSGLDIIGTLVLRIFYGVPFPNHIEWWTYFQFSSMITCLGWVFNQAILSWMATICFISEKNVRNYAFIIVLMLSSAPLPAVGLALYMLGIAVLKLYKAIRAKEHKAFWYDVFTPQNVILVLTLLPIYFFYYKTNVAVNVGQLGQPEFLTRDRLAMWIMIGLIAASAILCVVLKLAKKRFAEALFFTALVTAIFICSVFNLKIARGYLSFLLLEGGIYLFLIWRDNRREPLFYLTWVIMAICPLITVGTSVDFCMRASIPAVFILMLLCIKYLFDHENALSAKKFNLETVTVCLLVVALCIGAVTGARELLRGIDTIRAEEQLAVVNDWTYSMNRFFTGSLEGTDRNFIANDYTKTFFFKYLAK